MSTSPVIPVPPTLVERVEHLATAVAPRIARLALDAGPEPRPALPFNFGAVIIEAVASSAIEGIHATVTQAALAYLQPRHPAVTVAGRAVAANAHAIQEALDGSASYADHQEVHSALMRAQGDGHYACGFRTSNVVVGGHVAPAPRRVEEAMRDLAEFVGANPATVLHAAVAHAQFETIHPYPDGNGRIGRALLVGHLHRPVSVHLMRDRHNYYDALRDYRLGDAGPLTRLTAVAAIRGATDLRETAFALEEWDIEELSLAGQRAVQRLLVRPVGTLRRLHVFAAFRELRDRGYLRAASGDLGTDTVYGFVPLISAWANCADTDPYGTRSATSAERLFHV